MPIWIALLRGINVGGHKKIKMADLRQLFDSLGLRDTRTVLQSGNAVFHAPETESARLKTLIEDGIRDAFAVDVTVLLRTAAEFADSILHHPFTEAQLQEKSKVVFCFLSGSANACDVDTLALNNPGREIICAAGSQLYIFYNDGQGRSKLTTNRIERALTLHATARNWNTCHKILTLAEELAGQGS